MKVALSILTVDYKNVENHLRDIIDDIDYMHLDVMDGVFVPNISFGPAFIKSIREMTDKTFDTHLMIQNPLQYIEAFAKAGSDYITFHVEANGDPNEIIDKIHSLGKKAGMAVNPETPVESLKPYLSKLDLVLVMTVHPGFGGQSFMADVALKTKELKELREMNGYHYLINIDGGINNKTAPVIKEYVDMAVSGSYILNCDNPKERIEVLKNI